jgi:cytochrome c oxidase subunit I+III
VLLFIVNVLRSRRHGALAGDDPWGAGTLEWASRRRRRPATSNASRWCTAAIPLWQRRRPAPGVRGPGRDRASSWSRRADARPDHRRSFPSPSIWPFLAAVATTVLFVGSIFTPWAVVWGTVPVAIALTAWFWPRRGRRGPTRRW